MQHRMRIRDITSRNELADFLKISRSKLTYILYVKKVENYYNSFKIPKKNGDFRVINSPTGDLKLIQKSLQMNYGIIIVVLNLNIILNPTYLTDLKKAKVLLQMLKYIEIKNM